MPNFVYPGLLWGLLLAGVPVLIHLINMLRHRRVPWAAMEFLLASQRRNRARILLRQLLLLAVRMLAVATLVMVLAQPVLESRLGGLLRGGTTHHIVLLDDSFSMSDRWADTSAFREAKAVVERIATHASQQPQRQTFTLLRFCRASGPSAARQADLWKQPVDTQFAVRLRQLLQSLEPSHTAAGPAAALEAIGKLAEGPGSDQRIVYLVSDFRARQWDQPGDLPDHLLRLSRAGAKLHLIHCVERARPNLAITGLSPAGGTRAAGVPLWMEVTVKNFGAAAATDVPVLIQTDGYPQPALNIARIPPGQEAKERFSVQFPLAGQHVITTRLETDAVAVDNFRYRVVDFPPEVPVLVVDGDPEALDARYLSAALAPGGPVRTGISPRIEKPTYLSRNALDPFRAIYLLNVGRLDKSAIGALEEYLRAGGGVGIFLGERCQSRFINQELYRDGQGLFPLPLAGQAELLVDRLQNAPDLQPSGHPIFRIFAGQRNSFIRTVIVERYFSVPEKWQPRPGSTARVIARLRNGAPLAVEGRFGRGRVVVFLTTAAPTWNNWARNNPSFVVAMLELQAFLAGQPAEDSPRLVGTPLKVELDPSRYQARVRFLLPAAGQPAASDAVPVGRRLVATLADTHSSGLYEVVLKRKDGSEELRRYAFNVEAEEGDLKTLTGPQLAARLKGLPYEYHQAASFQYAAGQMARYNLAEPLLYGLVLMLVVEQVLACWASYHPRTPRQPAAKGGSG